MTTSIDPSQQPPQEAGSACGDPQDYCSGGENPGKLPEAVVRNKHSASQPNGSDYQEHEDLVMNTTG